MRLRRTRGKLSGAGVTSFVSPLIVLLRKTKPETYRSIISTSQPGTPEPETSECERLSEVIIYLPVRIWISKGSEVPVREQLTTQVIIAIASGELKPNEKLPSTRELARRFDVHSNTINAAYRELARRGWVDFRKGSGVYVRAIQTDVRLDGRLELDHLISAFITVARTKGFSLSEIRSRVKTWLEFQPPDHFLLIEPDADLRSILLAEIREATGFPASGTSLEECADPTLLAGSTPVVLYAWAEEARAKLPRDTACMVLRSR